MLGDFFSKTKFSAHDFFPRTLREKSKNLNLNFFYPPRRRGAILFYLIYKKTFALPAGPYFLLVQKVSKKDLCPFIKAIPCGTIRYSLRSTIFAAFQGFDFF
jgi:hypothetical protein